LQPAVAKKKKKKAKKAEESEKKFQPWKNPGDAGGTGQMRAPYLSIAELVKHFDIPEDRQEAFRKKIERCRTNQTYGDGFFREIANPKVNEPRYEYKTEKVALIIEKTKKE
jgi:hypothetical protein